MRLVFVSGPTIVVFGLSGLDCIVAPGSAATIEGAMGFGIVEVRELEGLKNSFSGTTELDSVGKLVGRMVAGCGVGDGEAEATALGVWRNSAVAELVLKAAKPLGVKV